MYYCFNIFNKVDEMIDNSVATKRESEEYEHNYDEPQQENENTNEHEENEINKDNIDASFQPNSASSMIDDHQDDHGAEIEEQAREDSISLNDLTTNLDALKTRNQILKRKLKTANKI